MLSFFFNISVADAMQKLQSGISGELEPLRRLGYDLSQARLEAVALSLGIDKSVASMTQAEKAELRYYAIMTQVTQAQGDMARTLESPANQLRVLKAQLEMCARTIGNIFIPALNAILPYAIAVVQVIREVAEAIAELFVKESTGDIQIPGDFTCKNIDISTNTGDINVSASTTGPMILKTSTGDINLENMSAGAMKLNVSTGFITVNGAVCQGEINIQVSTGKTDLTDVQCKKLFSKGDTGDIVLNHVIAEEIFSIERDTGDVRFNGSDALSIFVETDTGDVTGSLLSGKYFVVEADTGSVDVPKGTDGGRCEITTDTGDIKITIS